VLDLEGLANHRGSSFGGLGLPAQPSNEHYENRIAAVLERHRGAGQIWVEAESAQVGRCRVPAGLWQRMQQAPLLEIRRPLEERLRQLVAVYGVQDPQDLAEATRRIGRRLGPQRTAAALEAIERADWSGACREMLDYYDRCYDHELQRHGDTDRALATLEMVPEAKRNESVVKGVRLAIEMAAGAPEPTELDAALSAVTANPGDHAKRFELAEHYAAAGRYKDAADHLLIILTAKLTWEEGKAKEKLLQVFEAAGATDPVTIEGRRRLASLMFA
jgi:thioredoxin-like negative regulator of GroEL